MKYGAAAYSATDYPLICAGGRSGTVRVHDLGMAYNERLTGRAQTSGGLAKGKIVAH
jgi:hypothetical protein